MMPNTPHSSLNLSSMSGHSPGKDAFDRGRPGSFRFIDRHVDDDPSGDGDAQPVAAGFSNYSGEHTSQRGALEYFGHIVGRDGDNNTRGRFSEQRDRIVEPAVSTDIQRVNRHLGAGAAGVETTFGERHRQPAI